MDWFPQRTICYPSMQERAAQTLWKLLHEEKPWHDGSFDSWAKEPSVTHPFHRDDGVTIWVSKEDLTPDDDFLQNLPAADQPDADQH